MAKFSAFGVLSALVLSISGAHAAYTNIRNKYFEPADSSTFQLVELGKVNLTFLDKTRLEGYDAQDMVQLGPYRVESRIGMIEKCNSMNFQNVDGILGFGWYGGNKSSALLKTLTQESRPSWGVTQPEDFEPMPRKFAFTANATQGELHLGGYDPESIEGEMTYFGMTNWFYGVNVSSIKYGEGDEGIELLNFAEGHNVYPAEFDSGTTCLLIPNSTGMGYFESSPFSKLLDFQLQGIKRPLVYTMTDLDGIEHEFSIDFNECVEPSENAMIFGDAWFRRWVVLHDMTDLNNKKIGLGRRNPSYELNADRSDPQLVSAGTTALSSRPNGMVGKLAAKRHVRRMARLDMLSASESSGVKKLPLTSPTRVVYNVGLSVGTPPQEMEVIFDTGSYMLGVFAKPPPDGMIPIGMKHKKEILRRAVAKMRDMGGLKRGAEAGKGSSMDAVVGADGLDKIRKTKGVEGQRKRAVAETLKKKDQSPEDIKAALIRKALKKLRKNPGAVDSSAQGLRVSSMLQVQATTGDSSTAGIEDLEDWIRKEEPNKAQPLKVARVPALVGINAVLVAAVVVLIIRFKGSKDRRRQRSSDDYGSLARAEGAELI